MREAPVILASPRFHLELLTKAIPSSLSLSRGLAMDRVQMILLGLPLFLFCSDLLNLFTVPPPKPSGHQHHHHHHHGHHPQQPPVQQNLEFPIQKSVGAGGIGYGNTININFCSSCSYRFFLFSFNSWP
ncbi:selT-like protein isoform X2 [Macadamia integrifolia]|uniref:selT-like protein isoform X2 n=1 Tax=Macadamia integrifolia TaxID=60698 RepID=UPI001C4F2C12|nr:selT-like protein isoform X2 [Macadamia integrifolia]